MNAPVNHGAIGATRDAHLFHVENALATCRTTCRQVDAVATVMARYARAAANRTDPVLPAVALETVANVAEAIRFLAETAVDIADVDCAACVEATADRAKGNA